MDKELYRFRKIDYLLGSYQELKTQTIYFASPDQLNDPVDGFRDIYWDGDYIVWKNFFRHYLICLERVCYLQFIGGHDHIISGNDMPIISYDKEFPSDQYKNNFQKIENVIFENSVIDKYIQKISHRKTRIKRDELFFYLRHIHALFLQIIQSFHVGFNDICELINEKNIYFKVIDGLVGSDFFDNLEKNDDRKYGTYDYNETEFSVLKQLLDESNLSYEHKEGVVNYRDKFIYSSFTDTYIKDIEKLIQSDWYTSCFMEDYRNSSVWGNYGEGHSGVCLIFDTKFEEGKHSISLGQREGVDSENNLIYKYRQHQFYNVVYDEKFNEINFFKNIGKLSQQDLIDRWYSLDGKVSDVAEQLLKSGDRWREQYWKKCIQDITMKTKDWSYEKEMRLILVDSFFEYKSVGERRLNYDFKSLSGLIFGINTSVENKHTIINIIKEKCEKENRHDFKIYQAFYSHVNRSIGRYELGLDFLNM